MSWYVKAPDGKVFGPAGLDKLKAWTDESRITSDCQVSKDGKSWAPASSLADLGMIFLIELKPGYVFGPYSQKVIENMVDAGEFPPEAKVYVTQETLAAAMEEAESFRSSLAVTSAALEKSNSELEKTAAELEKTRAQLKKVQQELDEKNSCIVIDPEVLEPEEKPSAKPLKEDPPKVAPLGSQAMLEARLRNELLRARQKGMDFSFLKKR